MPFSLREALTTVESARGSPELYCDAVISAHKIAAMFGSRLTYLQTSEVTTVVALNGSINGHWSMTRDS